MDIYSWNVYFRNGNFDRVHAFIEGLDFDVLSLQEVPEKLLDELKKLPYHLAYQIDVDRLFEDGTRERNFLVIVSRHPILSTSAFPLEIPTLPLRARLFVQAMRPMRWSKIENRHGFYADIAAPGFALPLRVFCLHLTLAHPEVRKREFETAMRAHAPGRPTVVCGDFNILDSPLSTPFNWLLGGTVQDVLSWRRERRAFEGHIAARGLRNPLLGKKTHLLYAQLDHILVSKEISVVRARVVPKRHGSDHHPVHVKIGTANAHGRKPVSSHMQLDEALFQRS